MFNNVPQYHQLPCLDQSYDGKALIFRAKFYTQYGAIIPLNPLFLVFLTVFKARPKTLLAQDEHPPGDKESCGAQEDLP